jgi:CrcB protein
MPRPLPPRTAIVAVAAGGAIGAVIRYGATLAVPETAGHFPWTTFTINVTGCFLLALLPASRTIREHPWLPPALGTGVLGGFTTMSAHAVQTRGLADRGDAWAAGLYLFGTLAAALLAVAVADTFSSRAQRLEFEQEEGDL